MKVGDILRIKGRVLYTIKPDALLQEAVTTMAQHNIGSLLVTNDKQHLSGIITFGELLRHLAQQKTLTEQTVAQLMDPHPLTCCLETELNEIRRLMLERHARYMPVLADDIPIGVMSFFDVAKAVVEYQDFENKMLKAYIRNWPDEEIITQTAQTSCSP